MAVLCTYQLSLMKTIELTDFYQKLGFVCLKGFASEGQARQTTKVNKTLFPQKMVPGSYFFKLSCQRQSSKGRPDKKRLHNSKSKGNRFATPNAAYFARYGLKNQVDNCLNRGGSRIDDIIIKSNKMRLNIPQIFSPYFQSHLYQPIPLILYYIPPTQNSNTLESIEVPNVLSITSQDSSLNKSKKQVKTHKSYKIVKSSKLQKEKELKQRIKVYKNQLPLRTSTSLPQNHTKKIILEHSEEVKLDFRIQWKNQYRNVVPNLINQILSFLTKQCKSQTYLFKLFSKYSHAHTWNLAKFYQYMKRMKEDISHYVDQKVIYCFFQTHQTLRDIYQQGEQEYYMKIVRIAVLHYLRSEAIPLSLTSPRMNNSKRAVHLIARKAILNKFLEVGYSKFK